jgi:hypothetical protein
MSEPADRHGRDVEIGEVDSPVSRKPIIIHSKVNCSPFKKYITELIRVGEKIRQPYFIFRSFRPIFRVGSAEFRFSLRRGSRGPCIVNEILSGTLAE